jgi:hypothetical protein
LVRGEGMVIVLTMAEVENILKACVEGDFINEKFKEMTILDIDKINPSWKIYLSHVGLTIAEYNSVRVDLNKMSRGVAQELMAELLEYENVKKLRRRLRDLSRKFGDKVHSLYRDQNALIIMNDKKFLKLQYANHFNIMLGIEDNSRNMGYKDYQDLCDFRNS